MKVCKGGNLPSIKRPLNSNETWRESQLELVEFPQVFKRHNIILIVNIYNCFHVWWTAEHVSFTEYVRCWTQPTVSVDFFPKVPIKMISLGEDADLLTKFSRSIVTNHTAKESRTKAFSHHFLLYLKWLESLKRDLWMVPAYKIVLKEASR